MKRITLLLSFFIALFSCVAQISPQSKKVTEKFFPDPDITINTPAFEKKRGYTSYEELLVFLNKQINAHKDIMSMKFIGTSQKGKEIPMVHLNKKNSDTNKVKVWIQGGLHGNEMGSTESVLYLIDQLLNNNEYTYLLDKLEIKLVPMANIDGYEKESRYAANGLDLNRDQTKLNIQESVYLKQAFSDFGAEVALDLHEYRPYRRDFTYMSTYGITSIYDAMFLYSGNLNVPENLRKYTKERFVSAAEKVLDEHDLIHHDYMSTGKIFGEIHFKQGSENSRSSATSYALTNAVSSLIEVRGVGINKTSFKRRVQTAFLISMSYLKTAYDHAEELREEIAKAEAAMIPATAKTKKKIYTDTIKAIDLDKNEAIDMEVKMSDALQLTPLLQRERAEAYVILPEERGIIERLEILGLKITFLEEEKTLELEAYTVLEYEREAEKYEGVNRQTVVTELKPISKTFPKGTAIVRMDQSNANLAMEVLEPEVMNSFISFEVIETEKGAELPIYRLTKKDPSIR
ncbi:MAG: M14 family metallocarboxypeptidase [Vicingaceae bacterium]